jgi:hypothetical protein
MVSKLAERRAALPPDLRKTSGFPGNGLEESFTERAGSACALGENQVQ